MSFKTYVTIIVVICCLTTGQAHPMEETVPLLSQDLPAFTEDELFPILANISYDESLNVSKECSEEFFYSINHPITHPSMLSTYQYSGKNLNDLGDYKGCIKDPRSRYITLSVMNLPTKIFLGICGPAVCMQRDYEQFSPYLANVLNDTFQKLVPKDSSIKANIRPEDVVFTDVLSEHQEKGKAGAGFWICVAIFCFFVAFSLAAALYNSYAIKLEKEPTTFQKVINCFDLVRNYSSLVADANEKHDPDLKIFDGIRVLSIIWIVYGHTFDTALKVPLQDPEKLASFVQEFSKAHLYNATYSVDVFFFMSGFFLSFIVLQQLKHGTFTWQIYLHRLIRLYPALIVTYLISRFILPALGDGPLFTKAYEDAEGCGKVWHYIFLFIWNFKRNTIGCIGWIWYLANDLQFFVVTPPILYLVNKRPKLGLCVLLGLLGGSYISQSIVIMHYDIYAHLLKQDENYQYYYYQAPWARCPTYILGILLGYLYVQYKANNATILKVTNYLKDSRNIRIICYIVSLLGLFFTVQGLYWIQKYASTLPRICDFLYLVFSRSVFIVFFVILIVPALIGKGSGLRLILANKLASIMSKLTYGVYLLHFQFIIYYAYRTYRSLYVEYELYMFMCWTYVTLGYTSAIILSLFIETPLFNLEAVFLRPRRRPNTIKGGQKESKELVDKSNN